MSFTARPLLRRLQAGRVDPLGKMTGRIGLPRLAKQFVFLWAGCKTRSAKARILGECRKTILKRFCLLETTSLRHGALLSVRGRRERNRAFTSQIKATDRTVMSAMWAC